MIKLILLAIISISTIVIFLLRKFWSKEKRDQKIVEDTDMNDPASITSTFDKIHRGLIIAALLLMSGCARVVLHPIEMRDIVQVKQGESFEAPKDGYFLSDFYIKEVMRARVE